MHDLPLLINIGAALAVALIGGVIARRFGLPTIAGYLLAGVAIGPFTPGFVGDIETISQLAELGVIFLMFGVGLHFSFRDLWQVRDIAVPGALIQMGLATALAIGLSRLWGWSIQAGLVLGLAISIASTVVLLRGLMDKGLLETRHGQVAVGWLVLEDLATVLILVALPALAPSGGENLLQQTAISLALAGGFIALMLFAGARIVPWLLRQIAHLRSRELFILVVLVVALGTALGSAQFFHVSLALGAFLAGIVISESPFSHQVSAELLPFREAFAVLFFVSVGMLVNPVYVWTNIGQVLALSALIVLGKALVAAAIGFLMPHPARTALVVAAGLSQIGEFSFIVGQAGLALGLLDRDQYSLILAGALISITINPFMFRLIEPMEKLLQRSPRLWALLNRSGAAPQLPREGLREHVVIIGYGRVGHHIVEVLQHLDIPQLVIDQDPGRIEELQAMQVPVLFGDAANSEILDYARLAEARALVVTVPDEAAAALIVAAARQQAPALPIIARATTQEGLRTLSELGASDVIHPELEGGLEIVRDTLLRLKLPAQQAQRYADAVRRDHYHLPVDTPEEKRILRQLVQAVEEVEVTWFAVEAGYHLAGQSPASAGIRRHTGASVVAVLRAGQVIANPPSDFVFEAGDRVGLMGSSEQVRAAETLCFGEGAAQ